MRRSALAAASVLLAAAPALVGAATAQARAVVHVDWTFVDVEVAPKQETHAARVGTLFDIDGRTITDAASVTARLGQRRRGTSVYDVGYSVRYAASNGHLTKTVHTAGANFRVDVFFLPEGGCRAAVNYFRSPGKRYFETRRVDDHSRMIESDQHAEDVTCTVTDR